MPGVNTNGSILKGRINSTALAKHANDATDSGRINIPPGINGGIAQLKSCGFAEYKSGPDQGKPYFFAQGVVLEPFSIPSAGGMLQVAGLHTRIQVNLSDRKNKQGEVVKTQEDQLTEVMLEMRRLGGPTFTKNVKVEEDLEMLAKELEKRKPFFRFSTWQGKPSLDFPNPQVNQNWHGIEGMAGYKPPDMKKSGMSQNPADTNQTTSADMSGSPTLTRPPRRESLTFTKGTGTSCRARGTDYPVR